MQAPLRRPSRLDSLTPLRFVAAAAVFGMHFMLTFPDSRAMFALHLVEQAPAGVSFFFVLSGFVLTWSSRPDDAKRRFWRRRFARIFPVQFVAWAATGLILIHYRSVPGKGPALASLLLLTPWIPVHRYLDAMDASCWSLGCEMFFYLLFPYLLAVLSRRSLRDRRMVLAGTVAVAVGLATVLVHARPGSLGFWILYYFPPVRLLEFTAGMLLALELRAGSLPRIPLRLAAPLALGAYVAAGWAPPPYVIVSVTFVPWLLLIAAMGQRDLAGRPASPSRATLIRLGAWSYAFYLLHGPVLIVFAHLVHGRLGWAGTAAAALTTFVVSTAVAAICYELVERPSERAIREPGWRVPAVATGFLAAAGICLGAPVAYAVVSHHAPAPTATGGVSPALEAGASAGVPKPSGAAGSTGHRRTAPGSGGVTGAGTGRGASAPDRSSSAGGGEAATTPSGANGGTGGSGPGASVITTPPLTAPPLSTPPVTGPTVPPVGSCGGQPMPLGLTTCPGTPVTTAPPGLCTAYRCDGSVSSQTGYLVECRNGSVSMAGGTPSACADAGGVEAQLYEETPAPPTTTGAVPVPTAAVVTP